MHTPPPKQPTAGDDAAQEQNERSGNYGKRIQFVRGQGSALSVAAFYRAAEIRATTMGQLIMEYQRKAAEGGNFIDRKSVV